MGAMDGTQNTKRSVQRHVATIIFSTITTLPLTFETMAKFPQLQGPIKRQCLTAGKTAANTEKSWSHGMPMPLAVKDSQTTKFATLDLWPSKDSSTMITLDGLNNLCITILNHDT